MHFSPGDLLVAEPFMKDPNFKRSVVLICDHNNEGSFGLVMNRKLELRLNDVMPDFPEFEVPIFEGGPVGVDTLHFIHNKPELEGAKKLRADLYWSGNFEQLKLMVESQAITTQDIRFFIGYSGWSDGQLAQEMTYSSWMICRNFDNYLIQSDRLWHQVLNHMGGDYKMVANYPEDPELN